MFKFKLSGKQFGKNIYQRYAKADKEGDKINLESKQDIRLIKSGKEISWHNTAVKHLNQLAAAAYSYNRSKRCRNKQKDQ
ncbi:MAG: hypothetical protein IKJ66_07835 [Bacteroidaceae bacterium]|nr:hypothetical protein [Bacteroidaceae bacterium]